MPPLPSDLRNRLEKTVVQARRIGEEAARVALERLHVGKAETGSHLTPDERGLRNRLRAHGRQVGDQRDPKGTQSVHRLIHECAYEHWHRMLFARFLAENHLLMHPTEDVPVTLEECDELARDERAPDGWTLAARYAARMLPQIFRPDDPVLQVGFAPEHKRALEKMVTELPAEVFTADDSLGWVYQFWQAERKDEVNKSGDKITGETLPAVTQLFTEHYMVLFLLHNTIGAWWAARQLSEGRIQKSEWAKCQTEDDCRKLVSVPGVNWEYLRFVKTEAGEWKPAAGAFPGWPKLLKLFKLLDPCCGSGHILIAAFDILVRLRRHDEQLSAPDACDAVLRENLHGLELDPRCTQIAAFALALTAWKFTGGFRPLPPLNIACSGLGVNARKEDWLALASGDKSLLYGMEQLYDLFQKAPELGSLINPRSIAQSDAGYDQAGDLYFKFADIQPLLTKALQSEKARKNDDLNEIGVAAQGMAQAAALLVSQFNLVVTNVPYLARVKQGETLKEFCESSAPDSKTDLATVFLERCSKLCASGGASALVTPQNWHFLTSYRALREKLLRSHTWPWVIRLGPGAFETISGEVVKAVLLCLVKSRPVATECLYGLDASPLSTAGEKASHLRGGVLQTTQQQAQLKNPDARIVLESVGTGQLMSKIADYGKGSTTGDRPRFLRCFWELPLLAEHNAPWLDSPSADDVWAGREHVTTVALNDGSLRQQLGCWLRGQEIWGRQGVAVNKMMALQPFLYAGEVFDDNVGIVAPRNPADVVAIWCFIQSGEYTTEIRKIDQKLNVTAATLVKVPFDLPYWQRVAAEKFPNGLPEPASNDPTQWLFVGHPVDSTAPLQVGVARLLGYRWPRQTGQTVSGAPPVPADGLERLADEDGIVCLPAVRGEAPAAERLRALLAAAYGREWSPARQEELLNAVDYGGESLEDWLRNGFFEQHCKLFHQRPFVWQIWDGRKDGFSALVNYHQLDHKLLEKLTYTYLGDWIRTQQKAVDEGKSGADDRLLKAQQLQQKLELILAGEAPHDIFVRWKPLEQQPIGWHPDLNDGVRLNIRPFIQADVLRKRPNIKWGVDRGKNPPGAPWGEERDNDRHLRLEEKRGAKGRA